MNKFITVLALLTALSLGYVFHGVSQITVTVKPYSAENAKRVRAGIPKPYKPVSAPTKEVVTPTKEVVLPEDEITCLQYNIYFESRNQPHVGQLGTGWVTLNRVSHSRFDQTVCEVVYAAKLDVRGNPILGSCQFLWYCDGLPDTPNLKNPIERRAWDKAGRIARNLVANCMLGINESKCPPDPTHGALFFRSQGIKLTDPYYVHTATIQDHRYYAIR